MMFAAYLLVLTGAACLIPGYTTWATTGVFTVTGFTVLGILTTITGMGVAVVADYRATGRELVEYADTLTEVQS